MRVAARGPPPVLLGNQPVAGDRLDEAVRGQRLAIAAGQPIAKQRRDRRVERHRTGDCVLLMPRSARVFVSLSSGGSMTRPPELVRLRPANWPRAPFAFSISRSSRLPLGLMGAPLTGFQFGCVLIGVQF
jgi:hypothetical protein